MPFDINIVQDSAILPEPFPHNDEQLPSNTSLFKWESSVTENYLERVGKLDPVLMGSRFQVIVCILHGGSHAYLGVLRPYSIQLSQGCQLLVDLLKAVTNSLVVDGSRSQAYEIKDMTERQAVETVNSKL